VKYQYGEFWMLTLQNEGEFRRAVMSFLENIAKYKEAVDLLLTVNSRLVDSKNISF